MPASYYTPFGHRIFIPFKGNRQYISGTDIAAELIGMAGATGKVSIEFHKIATHQLFFDWITEPQLVKLRQSGELCALITYENEHVSPRMIMVAEDYSHKVEKSVPFDEAAVTEGSVIMGESIIQEVPTDASYLDRIVALNKKLLNEIDHETGWIFCALDLNRTPRLQNSIDVLALELVKRVGKSLRVSNIMADDEFLGTVKFAAP